MCLAKPQKLLRNLSRFSFNMFFFSILFLLFLTAVFTLFIIFFVVNFIFMFSFFFYGNTLNCTHCLILSGCDANTVFKCVGIVMYCSFDYFHVIFHLISLLLSVLIRNILKKYSESLLGLSWVFLRKIKEVKHFWLIFIDLCWWLVGTVTTTSAAAPLALGSVADLTMTVRLLEEKRRKTHPSFVIDKLSPAKIHVPPCALGQQKAIAMFVTLFFFAKVVDTFPEDFLLRQNMKKHTTLMKFTCRDLSNISKRHATSISHSLAFILPQIFLKYLKGHFLYQHARAFSHK